eukprot:CAMPEP_0182420804 /NCGR_PEP_ID=MMETSP1167-20130531/5884_1 /TAXON_ID=2988 /ORGANISM="Mallomonas Sp, Strain CCMP3275" /LENGTH=759 /DNA_ID=CAMNT_0024597271 /DNA_START=578 /DNA_END=2857 /DNA_ORIENTATION=+
MKGVGATPPPPFWFTINFDEWAWLIVAVAMLFIGAGFLSWNEKWSFLEAFYYSLTAITTVSYGSGTTYPSKDSTRIFFCFFIPISIFVLVFGVVSAIETMLTEALVTVRIWRLHRDLNTRSIRAYYDKPDLRVGRHEFCLAMMLSMRSVTEDEIELWMRRYEEMDDNKRGYIISSEATHAAAMAHMNRRVFQEQELIASSERTINNTVLGWILSTSRAVYIATSPKQQEVKEDRPENCPTNIISRIGPKPTVLHAMHDGRTDRLPLPRERSFLESKSERESEKESDREGERERTDKLVPSSSESKREKEMELEREKEIKATNSVRKIESLEDSISGDKEKEKEMEIEKEKEREIEKEIEREKEREIEKEKEREIEREREREREMEIEKEKEREIEKQKEKESEDKIGEVNERESAPVEVIPPGSEVTDKEKQEEREREIEKEKQARLSFFQNPPPTTDPDAATLSPPSSSLSPPSSSLSPPSSSLSPSAPTSSVSPSDKPVNSLSLSPLRTSGVKLVGPTMYHVERERERERSRGSPSRRVSANTVPVSPLSAALKEREREREMRADELDEMESGERKECVSVTKNTKYKTSIFRNTPNPKRVHVNNNNYYNDNITTFVNSTPNVSGPPMEVWGSPHTTPHSHSYSATPSAIKGPKLGLHVPVKGTNLFPQKGGRNDFADELGITDKSWDLRTRTGAEMVPNFDSNMDNGDILDSMRAAGTGPKLTGIVDTVLSESLLRRETNQRPVNPASDSLDNLMK